MTTKNEEAVKQRASDIARAKAFKEMSETKGWRLYVELLEYYVKLDTETALRPAFNMDEMIAQQQIKGVVIGIRRALACVPDTIKGMEGEVTMTEQPERTP